MANNAVCYHKVCHNVEHTLSGFVFLAFCVHCPGQNFSNSITNAKQSRETFTSLVCAQSCTALFSITANSITNFTKHAGYLARERAAYDVKEEVNVYSGLLRSGNQSLFHAHICTNICDIVDHSFRVGTIIGHKIVDISSFISCNSFAGNSTSTIQIKSATRKSRNPSNQRGDQTAVKNFSTLKVCCLKLYHFSHKHIYHSTVISPVDIIGEFSILHACHSGDINVSCLKNIGDIFRHINKLTVNINSKALHKVDRRNQNNISLVIKVIDSIKKLGISNAVTEEGVCTVISQIINSSLQGFAFYCTGKLTYQNPLDVASYLFGKCTQGLVFNGSKQFVHHRNIIRIAIRATHHTHNHRTKTTPHINGEVV